MFIFIEHIRKLTIEFLCLFEVRLGNTLSILPFQGWNTLGVFFLTINVPIEVSGVCLSFYFALTSPTKLFTYKSCCFLTSAFISLLKVSNFDLSLLLRFAFPHLNLPHLTRSHFSSPRLFTPQLTSQHLTSPNLILYPCLATPHLTSPLLTLPQLT